MYKIKRFSQNKESNPLETAGKVTLGAAGIIGAGSLANAGYASHNLRKSLENLEPSRNVGFLSDTHKGALKGLNNTAKNTSYKDLSKLSKDVLKSNGDIYIPDHVRSSNRRAITALKHQKLARTSGKIALGTAAVGGLMYGAGKLMNKDK